MEEKEILRPEIMKVLVTALELFDHVVAFWEAGAVSFDRIDEWSDVDLYVVCNDVKVEDTIQSFERALTCLSDVELRYRLPEPTWHGHSQIFYRLKNASPFLFHRRRLHEEIEQRQVSPI